MARPLNCGKCNKPKSQCKCGRPKAITPEVIDKLERAIRRDCTVKMSCSYAGISTQTYYDEYNRNKEFADRMDTAEDYLHIVAHTKIAEYVEQGDKDIIKEFKKKRDTRYKDKSEIEQNDNVTVDLSKASLEELWKIARGGK